MTLDEQLMTLALEQAKLGVGLTSPNPSVGAVIVHKKNLVLSTAHTSKAGSHHAEVNAIRACNPKQTRGATLYVSLEPCSTYGRTPPCTQTIINAGIKRVVYAMHDPNPAHSGKAAQILRQHGIEVLHGVLKHQAKSLLAPWTHWMLTAKPWVIAKAGSSLDGRLTRPPGESQWLTNPAARADAQQLRRRVDAILIGSHTLSADNPSLTIRGNAARGKTQPIRIIMAGKKRLNRKASVFTDKHSHKTIVYKNQSLQHVLTDLAKKNITCLLIEGGGTILGAAFEQHLVNEAHFYIAPLICGQDCTPTIATPLQHSTQLHHVEIQTIGDNTKISGFTK